MTLEELQATHWATLKKMVEEAGGQYENKEKSIQFLVAAGAVDSQSDDSATDKAAVEKTVEDLPTLKIDQSVQSVVKTQSKAVVMLDKSRPFGEIFGEVEDFPTARYSQGEHLFNSQGEKL
jgi:hypothetical protein